MPEWQPLSAVIPAKAGIHLQEKAWIPACAGMTEEETGMTNILQVTLNSETL
jgi:hypothetical protein